MPRECMTRRCLGCGERETDEQRGRHSCNHSQQQVQRPEGGRRHRRIVRIPTSGKLVEPRGEGEQADRGSDCHWLAPPHAPLARESVEGDDAGDRYGENAECREQREQVVPRPHLGVPPPERLRNFHVWPEAGGRVARDSDFGADRSAADAPADALERVGPVDPAARLLRLVRRRYELPALGTIVDPGIQDVRRQTLTGIGADDGPAVSIGQLSLESDDAAIGRETDPRFPRIVWNERANRPGEGRDILAPNERVQ